MSVWKKTVTAAAVGCGATAVMDIAAEVVRRATGVPSLDYALVGRWLGHLRNGTVTHDSIGRSEPVAGERTVGWAAHYAIGVAFAAVLLEARPSWRTKPTLGPALATGVLTTAAPWLLMQPAFGLGVAASRTPAPATARWRSLRAHSFYGLGLYVAGVTAAKLTGDEH